MSESGKKAPAATPAVALANTVPVARPKRARKTMMKSPAMAATPAAPATAATPAGPAAAATPAAPATAATPAAAATDASPGLAPASPKPAAKKAAVKNAGAKKVAVRRTPAGKQPGTKPAAPKMTGTRPEPGSPEAEAVIHARVSAAGDAVRRALHGAEAPALAVAAAVPLAPARASVVAAPVVAAPVVAAPIAVVPAAAPPAAAAGVPLPRRDPRVVPDGQRPLSVVFAAAEMVPFAKVGGLADVIGSLPAALAARGHRVHVFLPLYRQIDVARHHLQPVAHPPQIEVPWWGGMTTTRLLTTRLAGVDVYFIDYPAAFDRAGIYTDPEKKADYPDNALRWAFFSAAVLAASEALGLEADIFHANDHQTALVPVYLRTVVRENVALARAASVLSLHNMGYQGLYASGALNGAGFAEDLFTALGPFEFYGHVNLLKAGVWFADMLTTVSERYAQEIQSSRDYSYGLEGLLQTRGHDLVGIVNGVDYSYWDPRVDPHLPGRYTADDLSGKWLSKMELLKRAGLPESRIHAPVFGMVTRLVEQKGLDLLGEIAEQLLVRDVTLIVLGSGATEYQEMLSGLVHRFPDKVAAEFSFNEPLAHLIEAGADFFLMPSKYEPCGLNQLYSLRYGTIPIVRATGGLADTIEEWNGDAGSGTGFLFDAYTGEAFWTAIQAALEAWAFPEAIDLLRRNGMAQDFSWSRSATRYEMVYRWALERRAQTARVDVDAVAEV